MDILTATTQARTAPFAASAAAQSDRERTPSEEGSAFEEAVAALRGEVSGEDVAANGAAAGDPEATAAEKTTEQASEDDTGDAAPLEAAAGPLDVVERPELNGSVASALPASEDGTLTEVPPEVRQDARRDHGVAQPAHLNGTNAQPLGSGASVAGAGTARPERMPVPDSALLDAAPPSARYPGSDGETLAAIGVLARYPESGAAPALFAQDRPHVPLSRAQSAIPVPHHAAEETASTAGVEGPRRGIAPAETAASPAKPTAQMQPGLVATASAMPRAAVPLEGIPGAGSESARGTDPIGIQPQQRQSSASAGIEPPSRQFMSQSEAPKAAWSATASQPPSQTGTAGEWAAARLATVSSETGPSGISSGPAAQSTTASGAIAFPAGLAMTAAGSSHLFAPLGVAGGDGKGEMSLIDADLALLETGRTGPGQSGPVAAAMAEPRAVARQIAEALVAARESGVDVQLSPEELGRVKLAITQGESGLIVTVSADRPETLDLLRRHIDLLGDEFAALGLGDTAFSFNDPNRDSTASAPQNPLPEAEAEGVGDARGPDIGPLAQRLARTDAGSLDIRV